MSARPRRRRRLVVAALLVLCGLLGRRALKTRTERLQRNLTVARLGSRLGGGYAVHRAKRTFADAARREELDREFELRTGAEVAAALGQMKGVLMKLGQMASFLDDGLPEPMREALATLQQDAPPMSPELAVETLRSELGKQPYEVFAEWDPVPIAAASIGQVHRAITRDGKPVAVKIQYPGVDEAIAADLANADVLINTIGMAFPGFEPRPLVEELKERLTEELDYLVEADNQRLFASYYRDHPFISVPAVIDELSTPRVLTTELATGTRFRDVVRTWSAHEKSLAAEAIYRFVFRSMWRLHAFNGDPHPGNYLFRPGGRVTFLDFGLVKRFDPSDMATAEEMITAIVLDHDGDKFRVAMEHANLLKPGSGMSGDEVLEYFGDFYEAVLHDAPFEMTSEYARRVVQRLLLTQGKVARYGNLPPSMVIIQRINVGLYSILAELGAVANWRRVAEELWPFVDGRASTPLGEEEARWLSAGGGGVDAGGGARSPLRSQR